MITTMFKFILYYFLIGSVQLIIMDFFINKLAELMDDKERLTNKERLIVLILWPIYAIVFWFNFIKSLIQGDNEK